MRTTKPLCATLAVALALILGASAFAASAGDAPPKGGTPSPVDLNSATIDELTDIPGIGPTMAQRIVEWREQNGPFERVEDLMKVKGVGEKSLEKLRPYVVVHKPKAR